MHEIVTLQFGQRANYLGTHFWNTQESYFTYDPAETPSIVDHDINFRPGIGSDGSDTYTPRALIYDLKSGFGSLRQINALYETKDHGDANILWDGVQRLQAAPPVTPSPYQIALETGLPTPQLHSNDIRYWSDFNRVFFHPRSSVPLSSQSLTSQLFASDSFSAGVDLFQSLDQEAGGLLDRDLRFFVEECDSLQGFQVSASSDDAWGGFMSRYVEEMREEFGKKAVWVWGLEDGQRVDRAKQYVRIANTSRVLTSLSTNASGYVRLTIVPSPLPAYVHLEMNSDWSTTALLSSVIESITLPTRLRGGLDQGIESRPSNMAIFEDILNGDSGRNVWSLGASAKRNDSDAEELHTNGNGTQAHHINASRDTRINQSRDQDGVDGQSQDEIEPSDFDISFTPTLPLPQSALPSLQSRAAGQQGQHLFAQIESYRHSSSSSSALSYSLSQEQYLRRLYNEQSIVQGYHVPLLFPLLDSFPADLFVLTSQRSTLHNQPRKQKRSLQVDAALSTTSKTKADILTIRELVVGRAGRSMGLIDMDQREEMYDELTQLAGKYSYGFEDAFSDEDGETED